MEYGYSTNMAEPKHHAEKQERDNKGRFAAAENKAMVKQKKEIPKTEPAFASIVELQRSYMTHFTKILQRSDMALREDRQLQRQMRRDPDIMSPLFQRQSAVALLDWEIVPDDPNCEEQVKQAAELQDIFQCYLKRPVDFMQNLLDAVWYGPAAVQLTPRMEGDLVVPDEWMPIHSDTLAFTEDGDLAIYVGRKYEGEWSQGPYGMIHMLEEDEREQMILHTHNRQGADYEVATEAAFVYAGRGLRDVVWFQWMMKQTALQFWMTWIERYGMGIRIGTYPDGNAAAKSVMEEIMQNLVGDVSVVMPKQASGEEGYSLDIKEVNASQAKVFADLIEGYLAGQIKELIIGQSATTEATSTGLGSSVADEHAETFRRIVQCDAMNLADTLTDELVDRYHEYNFGDTDYRPRWEFSLEKNDPREFMEGVRSFVELGGQVSQRQARDVLGITEPDEGEPILQAGQGEGMPQEGMPPEGMPPEGEMPNGGGDIMSQLMGGMPQPPNGGQADRAFRKFAKDMDKRYSAKDK